MKSRRDYFRKWHAPHPAYREADNRKRAMAKAPKRARNALTKICHF